MKKKLFNLFASNLIIASLIMMFIGNLTVASAPTDSENIFDNSLAYMIVNKVSGYGLVADDYGRSTGIDVWQRTIDNEEPNVNGFMWLLIEAEKPYYWIVNKASGYGLVADDYGRSTGIEVWQNTIASDAELADGFKWEIVSVDGGYHIINKASRYGLVADDYGRSTYIEVWQRPIASDAELADGFIWNITKYEKLDCSEKLILNGGTSPEDIPEIPQLTSLSKIPSAESERVIIGETLLPFFLVNDPSQQSDAIKVKENPYYILRREAYWKRAYYYSYAGKTNVEESQSITIGLIESETNIMETTTGFSMTASASASYGGAEASVSATVYSELKVTKSQSTTTDKSETKTITRTYVVGTPYAEALWYRVDEYTLMNLNDVVIFQSTWIDATTKQENAFPEFEPTPTPTASPLVSPSVSPTPTPTPDSGFNMPIEYAGGAIVGIAAIVVVIVLLKRR